MTSATEELRRLLDERGVVYKKPEDDTTIYYDSNGNRYTYNVNSDSGWSQLFGYNLTPEQAIAATLGSDREAELQKALNKAAGNWAKADDELRKALDFMRIWISEDAHLGESAISRELEKAEGLRNLDAIESAIAAWNARAERTCHNTWDVELTGRLRFACSECGGVSLEIAAQYCPICGAKVVDA